MDILDFELEETAVMPVRHIGTGLPLLTEDGAPVTITLASKDSDRFQRALNAQREFRLKKAMDTGQQRPSLEEIRAESVELIAASTLGWSGITVKGEAFQFSNENARELYRRLPWLLEQADTFVADRANFLKASAKG
jgi:hypothetical protein